MKPDSKFTKDFYERNTKSFSSSRARSWSGWELMWDEILSNSNFAKGDFSILDIGCGNGRLGEFYATKCGDNSITYLGVDISAGLLSLAETKLNKLAPKLNYQLKNLDITDSKTFAKEFEGKKFNIINMIAVLHHVYSHSARLELLRLLQSFLTETSLLIISTWDFMSDGNARKLVVEKVPEVELDKNDYILSWEGDSTNQRYVHHFETVELEKLLIQAGYTILTNFAADGRSGKLNQYYICKITTC